MFGIEIRLLNRSYMDTFALYDHAGRQVRIWRREVFVTKTEGGMFGLRLRPVLWDGLRKRGYQLEQVRYKRIGESDKWARGYRVLRDWRLSSGIRRA